MLQIDSDAFDECEGLGLHFELEFTEKSEKKLGTELAVTSDNRETYVALKLKYLFETQIADQLQSFSRGFEELLSGAKSSTFFSILELGDLDSLLRGSEKDSISVKEWKARTDYERYEETDDVIIWFWKAVKRLNQEQRHNLLCFWTAIKYLPREGFQGLPMYLTICKPYTQTQYPTSQTCLFVLHLPVYENYEALERAVSLIAREDICSGFGLY